MCVRSEWPSDHCSDDATPEQAARATSRIHACLNSNVQAAVADPTPSGRFN